MVEKFYVKEDNGYWQIWAESKKIIADNFTEDVEIFNEEELKQLGRM